MKAQGRILIVYYSRTGTTRKVAEAIHRELGGELVKVTTRHYPTGLRGYVTALADATLRRAAPIRCKVSNFASYDLVVVGTPVWGASLPSPIRTYMAQSLPQSRQLAFFLTHGGSGALRVFGQMEDLAGKRPLATMAVTDSEAHHRTYAGKMRTFVERLRRGSEVPKAA